MLEVSQAWRDSILNPQITRHFRLLARIDLSGTLLVSGISNIITPAGDETTKADQLADGIIAADHPYASLDDAWVLGDGKYAASTVYGQTGYVGKQLSGAGGVFSEVLTFVMSTTTTVNHITVAFDDKLDEYAVDFDIAFLNASNIEIGRWQVTDNESYALSLNAGTGYPQMNGVKSYKLIIKKWSHAGRTAKVAECYSGSAEVVTGDDRLISMNIDESAEPTSSNEVGAVMANVLTLHLDNADGRYTKTLPSSIVHGLDMRKKLIQAYAGLVFDDGKTEMLPMGTYYVDDWSETDGDTALTVKATDVMAALDKVTYRKTENLTYPATVEALIIDVFLSVGLGFSFEIDDAYGDLTIPSEPDFKNASCRAVLKYCAQLMNGSILQTRDAQIRCIANIIEEDADEGGLFDEPVLAIGPEAYFTGSKSSDNVSGPTRVIVKYGPDEEMEAVKADADEESKNGITELTISGNPIAKTFVTENQHFADLAWSVLKYCGYARKWLDFAFRGDPALEAGDFIEFEGTDGVTRLCRLSKQTSTLDGSLRVTAGARY